MTMSDKLKFIFLHFNKSGGTSIEKAVKKYGSYRSKSCDTAITAREVSGKKWDKYFTFAIVRNPWSKMVSLWLYRRKIGKIPRDTSFEYFVRNVDMFYDVNSAKEKRLVKYRTRSQWNSCIDEKGNVILDYIGRFENLGGSWKHFCKKIGKNIKLPHVKSTKHGHYSEYYDKELKKIVSERFTEDIKHFGYEFEDRHNA